MIGAVPQFVSDATSWLALVTATGAALAVLWRPLRAALARLIHSEMRETTETVKTLASDLRAHMQAEDDKADQLDGQLAAILGEIRRVGERVDDHLDGHP